MASRAEIDALKAALAGLSESAALRYLGVGGAEEIISRIQNAPESDGADSVLALVGGKLRSMPLASLAELLATGVAFRVRATPSDAKVTINGVERASAFVEFGTEVEWEVSKDGYVTKSGSQVVTENTTIEVDLAEGARFTIVPTPEDATVTINGEKTNSAYVEKGSTVEWEVSEAGYTTQSGSQAVTEDVTLEVALVGEPFTFKYNYNGSINPQIYFGSGFLASSNTICKCDGDFYVEVNGVRIEGNRATLALGEYMTEGENEVKIYTENGAKLYSAYNANNGGDNARKYITDIMSWGICDWGACDYLLYGNESLKEVPAFSKGFAGATDFSSCFQGCSKLTTLPENLFASCASATNFQYCFYGCTGLTSLPSGMFEGCSSATNFQYCFYGCTGLTTLPENLFASCTSATTFYQCFYGCTGLTTLPENLFASCSSVTTLSYCFYGCTGLTTLPENLFASCASVTSFERCFQGCTGLTSLPSGLFGNCPSVTSFQYCFRDCSGLTTLPSGLFGNCPSVTTFYECFYGRSGLTSLPENLFASCTKVTNFGYCFNTGYANLSGESAYDRVDIDGVETIIHLYERENYPDLYTKPSTTTYCYRYQSKLDDYDSIPSGWK